jgi:CheY-like chemotaxis protein
MAEAPASVILMDIQLPGLDGLTLTRQLKADQSTAAIPVIALTAYAMVVDRERALAAGCPGYIAKPIDTTGLGKEICKILGPDWKTRADSTISAET